MIEVSSPEPPCLPISSPCLTHTWNFYHLSTKLPPCRSQNKHILPDQCHHHRTPDLVFQSEPTHSFIKWSWFCLAMSGKFLTPQLAINNWFNSDETEDKIIVAEKNASSILITKEAWLTKFPLCLSSILKARERAFHSLCWLLSLFLLVSSPTQSVHSPETQSSQSVESS